MGLCGCACQVPLAMASEISKDAGVQIDIVPQLDYVCLAGGLLPWYFGVAGGLPIGRSWRQWPVRAMGCATLAASIYARRAAIEAFTERKTPVPHCREVTSLVTDGVFAWSRNPMYLGMVGSLGAFGLLTNSWWNIISALPYFGYLHIHVVPQEERYLRAKFGDAFIEYERRTPRWCVC